MQEITPEQDKLARENVREEISKEFINQAFAGTDDDPRIGPLKDKYNVTNSTAVRVAFNVKRLKTNTVVYKTRTVVACFKMAHAGQQTVFGYIHGDCDGTEMIYRLVCAGPTYHSLDGEYRSRIINVGHMNYAYEDFGGMMPEIEDRLAARIASGDLAITTEVYQAIGCKHTERRVLKDMESMRATMKLLLLCWICDVFLVYHGVEENHINSTYKAILAQPADFKLLEKLMARIGKEELYMITVRCSYQLAKSDKLMRVWAPRCGQKVFPLSPMESLKTDDINYAVWREIYVTTLASNLVVNFIAPGFPFIITWTYIQNANAALFDNKVIQDQYVYSEIATKISAGLKEIDRLNYLGNDYSEGPVSAKFGRISRDIHQAVSYADSSVRLTDLALCMFSEWVGRTIRDIPAIIGSSEGIEALPRVFADVDIFAKHMFEFIYGFYCMNSRIGLIHSDLHLNNTTIYMFCDYFNESRYNMPPVGKRAMVCVAGGVPYMFEQNGLYSMTIDLSKAILGDRQRLEHEFGAAYAEMFLANQTGRILHVMYQYFGQFMEKNGEMFRALLATEFPLIFKVLTTLDTYVLMSNFRSMIKIDPAFTSGRAKVADGAMDLLDKIVEQAEDLITGQLEEIIAGTLTAADAIEWPNLVILRDNFAKYELKDPADVPEDTTISDFFNSDLELIYDVVDPDSWGPILGPETWVRGWKRTGVYDQLKHNFDRWNAYVAVDETPTIEKLAEKYESQEAEALRFEEWMLL